MPKDLKPKGSTNRRFFSLSVNVSIIIVCLVLFSYFIHTITLTDQVHSYQNIDISLVEGAGNKQTIAANGMVANLSSNLDKTLGYAPALSIGANQTIKEDVALSSMSFKSSQSSILIGVNNASSNKTWLLQGNSFFLTFPNGDQIVNKLSFNFTTANLEVNSVYPDHNFSTTIGVDKYVVEYAVTTVHNNLTGKNSTEVIPEAMPVYESLINTGHYVVDFGIQANVAPYNGIPLRMVVPTSIGFAVNNVYYSAPACTITIENAQSVSVSFSGETANIVRIPLNSISEMNFEAYGPPYPSLNVSSKNATLLDTNDGTTISGSYNLTLRSLAPVQVYAFEYENFSNLNLSGFYYYVVDIHSTIALAFDKSGYFFTSTSFVYPLWLRTLESVATGAMIPLIIEAGRNISKIRRAKP